MPARWLAEFDCEDCGPFSDFASAALVSEQRHRPPPVALPHELIRATSEDDKQDEEDYCGGPAD